MLAIIRHCNSPAMKAAELQLCAGRVPFRREIVDDESTEILIIKGEEVGGSPRAIERLCAKIAQTLPSHACARTTRMEVTMEKCSDVIDAMRALDGRGDWETFEKKVLNDFLNCFEDDFYVGKRVVGAPDVSLFNVLHHAEMAGLTAWKQEYPELLDHYDAVAREGLISDYLEAERSSR